MLDSYRERTVSVGLGSSPQSRRRHPAGRMEDPVIVIRSPQQSYKEGTLTCQLLLDGILGTGVDHFALKGCTLRGPEDKARKLLQLPPDNG